MSSSTALPPPPTLPFPIVVQQLRIQAGKEVKRGDILLQYSFSAPDPDDRKRIQKRVGSWECPIEGKLVRWNVKVGEEVGDSRKPLLHILEPCTHAVQLEGLCALCGKDLTTSDYLGPSQASRASIRMSHDTTSVLVSLEEASRLDTISTSHLLSTRRLSLIVDLDQTIIHATVDPTVGEWMDECGLIPSAEGKGKGKDISTTTTTTQGKGKGRARRNPNEEALRDVGRFKLGLSAGGRVEDDCWYYIKPRPGLPAFLADLSKLYEMHVYTMGTRAYAEKVCEVIDPKGEFFGRRILSRDESGSLTAKSIARLFPVDTSMVVIIDDRSDVWEGSRNLVKVVPYDFFVGIGDINSSFLPKLPSSSSSSSPSSAASSSSSSPKPTTSPSPTSSSTDPTTSESSLVLPTAEDAEHLAEAQLHVIEDQIGERSLAKQQEKLEAEEEAAEAEGSGSGSDEDDGSTSASEHGGGRGKALLRSDDEELERLEGILREIHHDYYDSHDRRKAKLANGTPMKAKSSSSSPPDVKVILDQLKANVLRGCRLLFSGVIPLGAAPETTEIWQLSKTYGASCEKQLSSQVTHLLAKQEGTLKVQEASKPPYSTHIKIVHPSWLIDSIAQFRRLDEDDYLLIQPPPPPPRSTTPPHDPLPPSGLSVTKVNGTTSSLLHPSSTVSAKEDGELDGEEEEDEEDLEEVVGDIDLGELDWGQADRELDEFLDESSDDGGGSGDVSETESISSSHSRSRSTSSSANGRKRPRPSSTISTPSDPTDPSTSSSSSRPTNPIPSKRSRMDPSTHEQQPSSPNGMEDADEEDDEDEEGLFGDSGSEGSETGTEGDAGEMEAWAKELEGSFEGS